MLSQSDLSSGSLWSSKSLARLSSTAPLAVEILTALYLPMVTKHLLCALQNRYMKSAKDWGWREFITLQALFDADAGYLVNDDCIFAAEVLMLKESSEAHQVRLFRLPSTWHHR